MNYMNIYHSIINNAKSRNLKREKGYCIHHIIPSIYFKNRKIASYKSNMVKLTHKEHYVCHHLLSKTGCVQMTYAFWFMSHLNKSTNRLTSKEYEELTALHQSNVSKQFKNRILSSDHKQKIGNSNKGNSSPYKNTKQSIEQKQKTSEAISEWWKQRKLNGYTGMSSETKSKMKNRIPWNKGLSKDTDDRVAKVWLTRKHLI